jgi:hypothetical protein
MCDYVRQIESALRATRVESLATYCWFGKRAGSLPVLVRRSLTPGTARGYLLFQLQSQLYRDFYCRGSAQPALFAEVGIWASRATQFVESLSAANSGKGCWQPNWLVSAIEEAHVVVEQRGLRLWARPESCVASTGMPVVGEHVSVRLPKEFFGMSPGFYMIVSDEPYSPAIGQAVVRIYWNLSVDAAIPFVQYTTTALNEAGLPFRMKVLPCVVHSLRLHSTLHS